jgi:hypothetical protein
LVFQVSARRWGGVVGDRRPVVNLRDLIVEVGVEVCAAGPEVRAENARVISVFGLDALPDGAAWVRFAEREGRTLVATVRGMPLGPEDTLDAETAATLWEHGVVVDGRG